MPSCHTEIVSFIAFCKLQPNKKMFSTLSLEFSSWKWWSATSIWHIYDTINRETERLRSQGVICFFYKNVANWADIYDVRTEISKSINGFQVELWQQGWLRADTHWIPILVYILIELICYFGDVNKADISITRNIEFFVFINPQCTPLCCKKWAPITKLNCIFMCIGLLIDAEECEFTE